MVLALATPCAHGFGGAVEGAYAGATNTGALRASGAHIEAGYVKDVVCCVILAPLGLLCVIGNTIVRCAITSALLYESYNGKSVMGTKEIAWAG
jgi:hypothetical protein